MIRPLLPLSFLGLALLLSACPSQPPATPDAGSPSLTDAGTPDAGNPPPGPSCAERCTQWERNCDVDFLGARCQRTCEEGGATEAGLTTCLQEAGSACVDAQACLSTWTPAPHAALQPGPYGVLPRQLAGPFTLQTTMGPFSLAQEWTGEDHFVFVVYYAGASYSGALLATPLEELLQASPPNVHYVFLRGGPSTQAWQDFVERSNEAIASLDTEDAQHWEERVHFGDEDITEAEGWVGDLVRNRLASTYEFKRYDGFQWAIDAAQRVREVGMLGVLGGTGTAYRLSYLANEVKYYEFERAREARLSSDGATVVKVLEGKELTEWEGPNYWRDAVAYPEVVLPDAETLASYDTLEVDLSLDCLNHRDGDCGAWDYLAQLFVCGENDTVEPSWETCGRQGDANGEGCVRQPRPSCDTELARWITPYWREGRWVTDISPMLPLLQKGGRHTFRWMSKHQFDAGGVPREVPYVLSLSLRFSRRQDGVRPVEVHPLWTEGGALNSDYASLHPPLTFTVPEDVKRVELVAFVTGHGADTSSCSEFCNNTHHFRVNGKAAHSLTFPTAATQMGCFDKVGEGVVPNQSGTWYYGRAGWCPGWDVKPYVTDVTADLVAGENTVSYSALIGTQAPVSGKAYGSIALSSYLVYYR